MSEMFQDRVVKIKVIGVGGAGNNVINRMIEAGVGGVDFVVINTDKQDLNKSICKNKVQIGEKLTGGMGAGSKPEIGQKSAEESRAAIAKILEGTKLKIARPFLKRTPMGVIIDEIEMMIICQLDSDAGSDTALKQKAQEVLKRYNLVREIDDERSKMDIYIDTPQNDRFSEIILYHTRPEPSIMLFVGNFTVESLVKVGEVSEQQRKHLKKNK